MANTKKVEKMAVFRLEKGKLTTGEVWQYGGSTITTFTGAIAIPYTDVEVGGMKTVFEDESVESHAFKSDSVKAMLGADLGGLQGNMKYIGMDRLQYWAFGYEDGGSSPQDLGDGVYSHVFELDKHDRHFAPYRTAEQTAGDYHANDRKNRFALLGLNMGPQNHRYPFLACNGFEFASSAGGPLTFNYKGVARSEDRGAYSVTSCTYATGITGGTNMVMHHHLTAQLGESGSLATIGVKDVSISVDAPLTRDQDSVSGLYTKENELEGKYTVGVNITLSRHSADTWKAFRDNHTALCLSLVWSSGSYQFGLYFPSVKITESPTTGDNVANETLTVECYNSDTNPFTIGSHNLIQKGPVFCYVKNNNDTNEMRRE
jgi:hypothetical protein